jgi:hypothetical protein
MSMRSREFWSNVGGGDSEYDVKVGQVTGLLCSKIRAEVESSLIPKLIDRLVEVAMPLIGNFSGEIDYQKLFREVNP